MFVPEFDIQEVDTIGWLEKNVNKLSCFGYFFEVNLTKLRKKSPVGTTYL